MIKKSVLTKRGIWHPTDALNSEESKEFAQRIEELGYSMLWIPETTGRDPFAHIAYLASVTENLHFATGIANIYHRLPGVTRQASANRQRACPGCVQRMTMTKMTTRARRPPPRLRAPPRPARRLLVAERRA